MVAKALQTLSLREKLSLLKVLWAIREKGILTYLSIVFAIFFEILLKNVF